MRKELVRIADSYSSGGGQVGLRKRERLPTIVVTNFSRHTCFSRHTGLEAEMRAVIRIVFLLSCLTLSFTWTRAAPAAETTYKWSDIDCRQSRIASWPGLRCKTTNVVTTEGNVGAYRKWSSYGTTSEGYFHLFLWEAQNSFSYINVDQTTAEFLAWMYEKSVGQFSPVARYHEADYSTFQDGKHTCVGFRKTGNPRRGGYEKIIGGIFCAPAGRNLTSDQMVQFIDRVRVQ